MSGSYHVDLWLSDYMGQHPICLLNGSRLINPNMTYLLKEPIVLTCWLDFIKMKKKIVLTKFNYEKPKKIKLNIKFRTNE